MIGRKKNQISEKTIKNKEAPSGTIFDTVHITVYEVELDAGPYHGYDEHYGIELYIYDDMLNQGKYEYYKTVPIKKIGQGRIKSFITKIKREQNFDSLEDMIISHVSKAVNEADEEILSPEYKDETADTPQDKAEATLDALEEIE
jgi:hypothetical protein